MTIEKLSSFHVMLIYFAVSQITLLTEIFFVIWSMLCILPHDTGAGRKFAKRQHKQTWRWVNVTKKGVIPRQKKDSTKTR